MSHSQKISCQCHGVSGVLVSKKKKISFLDSTFWQNLSKSYFGHKLAFLVPYHILIIENAIYAVYTLHVAVAIGNQAICI